MRLIMHRLFAIILFALLGASPAYAQDVSLGGPQLYVSVSPQYPKAGETVTLTVHSPLNDISRRAITWKNAGTVVLQGDGETVYRMVAPAEGDRADISVTVEGVDDEAAVTIAPVGVELMWEADTYAPGLYLGRRLPAHGGSIRLQALPHLLKGGAEIPASQLYYVWKKDGTALTSSGKGRMSITVPTTDFSDATVISVSVTSADQAIGAERSETLRFYDPDLRLYFEHPLYGTMYHAALGSKTALSDTEMSFTAVPYFAAAAGQNDPLFSYIWRVNKSPVQANDERPATLTINAGSAGGEADIDLSLTHKKNFQLNARGSWNILFGTIAGISGGSATTQDLFGR